MVETITGLLPILAAVIGGIAGIKFVSEGERAILMRWEKAVKRKGEYVVVHPGFKFMIPKMYRLARIHVRQRTINFPLQTIVLSDHTIFKVSAVLLCQVKDTTQDLYNALFETTGVNGALTDYGLMVVRDALMGKSYEDLSGDGRQEIANEMQNKLQAQADQWGVQIIKFELSDCEPTDETARLIQTSANATFRAKALTGAATELGLKNAKAIPPSLAAVLVGIPMVASASTEVNNYTEGDDD
jgi:regulator of protease activity HflC (stomatin/prohibitin superfamily)